jgi:hypothetical protein
MPKESKICEIKGKGKIGYMKELVKHELDNKTHKESARAKVVYKHQLSETAAELELAKLKLAAYDKRLKF